MNITAQQILAKLGDRLREKLVLRKKQSSLLIEASRQASSIKLKEEDKSPPGVTMSGETKLREIQQEEYVSAKDMKRPKTVAVDSGISAQKKNQPRLSAKSGSKKPALGSKKGE